VTKVSFFTQVYSNLHYTCCKDSAESCFVCSWSWDLSRDVNWVGQNCTVWQCVSRWCPWKLGRCRRNISAQCRYSHTWLQGD